MSSGFGGHPKLLSNPEEQQGLGFVAVRVHGLWDYVLSRHVLLLNFQSKQHDLPK